MAFKKGGVNMNNGNVQEDIITVHCNCGQRLFDMERSSTASVSIKCPRCKAVMVVTMKNQKYKCTDQRKMEYDHSVTAHANRQILVQR